MPEPISFGELDFKIVASMEKAQGAPEPETPFRIAILGDFSGRTNRGIAEQALAGRRPLLVDRDNIDDVLKKVGAEINIPIMGPESPPVNIKFHGLDDFHPDSLFERLDIFQALKDTRQGIKDPSMFESMVKNFQGSAKSAVPSAPADVEKTVKKISTESTGDLLDQVLEETETTPAKAETSRGTSEWDNFLRRIVQPHIVPDIEPRQAKIIASVDAATSEFMRMVLHHPDFQVIEAAWRAVYFLTSRLETEEKLKLYLIDISKDELSADLADMEDLRSTGIYKLLAEQTVETFGGEPWAVLAGNYTFNKTIDDVKIMGRMAKIAKASGAPFITSANDTVLGCESLASTPDPEDWTRSCDEQGQAAWNALRKMPEAAYLGLALPRFILRLPYGEDTDAIDSFEFEEMAYVSIHNLYLWGNTAFACVYLLGQSFSRNGWDFRPGVVPDIEGLPLHIYKENNESRTKPCAEVVFTEQAAEAIIEKGIMPLLSYKNQDRVRLARFQSLADPPTNLPGPWID
jgi:type VI secretion system protein ImpC